MSQQDQYSHQQLMEKIHDMKNEIMQKLIDLHQLIEQTRCQCNQGGTCTCMNHEQMNELKQLISAGSCHCPQSQH